MATAMEKNRAAVLALIQNRAETMYVDYKRDFYDKLHASDFPKDIAAFANQPAQQDRYIIFGVEDKTREVVGIDPQTYISVDTLDAYISETIEPFVHIESELFPYEDRWLAYIKITAEKRNAPYVIKETCGKGSRIEKGDIYIRKGTCNLKADRMDLDAIYLRRITENWQKP